MAGPDAYAYHLGAATAKMRDLGTLGGRSSSASDVSESIVVGSASTRTKATHAFAYDLTAASPRLRDLGRVHNAYTQATAVSGSLVIGLAFIDRTTEAGFVYDLAAVSPRMHVISLGGTSSRPTSVDENIVVGTAQRAGDETTRFFAYDCNQAVPQMSDLGPADDDALPVISANVAVDTRWVGDDDHAVAWALSRTTRPALRLDPIQAGRQENVGRVVVTVTRGGDPGPAVTVPYSTRELYGATTGEGAVPSGILTFASGQTSGSFSVPIRDDGAPESYETVMVLLGQPAAGAIRGAPNTAAIHILASDQRPDGWISIRSDTGYIGNHIYNSTGARQTKTRTSHRARTRSFYARIYNHDNDYDATLTVSQPRPGSGVRYYLGTRDVTTPMLSANGLRVHLGWHAHRQLVMRIRTRATARVGAVLAGSIRATWVGDGARTDLVKGIVRVVR